MRLGPVGWRLLGSWALISIAAAAPARGPADERLEALLGRLERPQAAGKALESLEEAGAPALALALDGFAEASAQGRIGRAELVVRTGTADQIEAVLGLLDDPEPKVRRRWMGFLADPALGTRRSVERTAALERAALNDPSGQVRRRAIRGLGTIDAPSGAVSTTSDDRGAGASLLRLLDRLFAEEAELAADALADRVDGAPFVVERVTRAFTGAGPLQGEILARLFLDYGASLAEARPDRVGQLEGGRALRAPFLLARNHPSAAVRSAAGESFERGLLRLRELGREPAIESWLSAFEGDGWRSREMVYRRVHQAFEEGRIDDAEVLAARLMDVAGESDAAADRTWRLYARHFLAACDFARGDFAEARKGFGAAARLVRGLLRERVELRPVLREVRRRRFPAAPYSGALAADRWLLLALEEMWIATTWIAESGEAGAEQAIAHAHRAHAAQLRAQLVATTTDAGLVGRLWDELFARDLGPRRLILQRTDIEGWGGERSLDLSWLLARVLASVAPEEMPGFEPFPVSRPELADVFLDNERFQLLLAIEEQDLSSANRDYTDYLYESRLEEIDPLEQRSNPKYIRYSRLVFIQRERANRVGHNDPAARAEVYRELREYRKPSDFALTLSADLRVEGRTAEAEELSRAMLAAMEAGIAGLGSVQAALTSARLELSISSSLMDADQPHAAEERALAAVRRLEELESSLVERSGGAGSDPALRAWYQSALASTRSMLSSALLSLAVNANVRLKDPERALGFFERAYELEQNEFMRVLLGCYRARSGRAEEARSALATVTPAPQLYYNLACTHALLGDTDVALDYLQREFAENHPTPGSLDRQKEWARGDPDLASLRGHPRFERLVTP